MHLVVGPLVRIKQALTRLKSDVSQMELRTGVVSCFDDILLHVCAH